VKHRIAFYFFSFFLFGFLLATANATAQTIGFRQTNLASNLPNVANNVTPGLVNPWGIAFLSDQPFFIADNKAGRVTALDGTGLGVVPGSFIVPDAAGTGFDTPTGIVADQNSFFGDPSLIKPFILVTEQGTILTWGPDANGNLPQQATPRRRIASAVYKGAAILNSLLTAPALAVTDFHGGTPTGEIAFQEGNASLGSAPLDGAGVAALRINTLAAGAHSLTASYSGDGKFGGSMSAAVTITIANADFSLGATPTSAAVIAGQSTQFMLTVTPAGGFANNVTFSCSPITGITCTFNPAMVTPVNGTANTTLTVTTSATIPRYGLLMPDLVGSCALLVALALFSFVMRQGGKLRTARASLLTATAAAAIVALGLAIGGCGGYGSSTQPNRGTASIRVTAQSGNISHMTTVSVTVQ